MRDSVKRKFRVLVVVVIARLHIVTNRVSIMT